MQKLKTDKDNKQERMNFVEYWADFVKNNPDKIWSKQQKILIDSQIENARNFKISRKDYLEIKNKKVLDSDAKFGMLLKRIKEKYPRARPTFSKITNKLLRLHS